MLEAYGNLHSPMRPVYAHRMHVRRYNAGSAVSRRCLAGMLLVTFTLANVGWPLNAGSGHGRCAMTGEARCCCGLDRQKSTCGCFKKPVREKTASCCQKKRAAEKSVLPVLNCACGDSSSGGFIVSSQPRLVAATVEPPELTLTSAVSAAAPLVQPNCALPPETPPPRPSVC